MTFGSDLIISFIELSSPLKSGISDSTIVVGHKSLIALIALATLSGSPASSKNGLPLLTAQNLQPRVHMSPMIIIVAVPVPQHSDILGHLASSQTVLRF